MNVGIVLQNDYPDDAEVRPRRTAKTFADSDHEAVVYAMDRGETATVDYASIRRFSWFRDTALGRVVTAAVPFNPFWVWWLVLSGWRDDIDVLVGSNIRAGLPALVAARLLGIGLILDLQENNPEVVKLRERQHLAHHLTRNPRLVGVLERFLVRQANVVWVVVAERKLELQAHGVRGDGLVVVGNYPLLSEIDSATDGGFEYPGQTLVYVGAITPLRGLDRLVRALATFPETSDLTLAIAGDGPAKTDLEALTAKHDVGDRVFFTGWIDPEQVPRFIDAGDIGVIPHQVTPFTNTTVPNKLFDYMAAGLPVIASPMTPVDRILESASAGKTVTHDRPPKEVADRLVAAIESADLETMGQNGRAAVDSQYNWNSQRETILQSLERARIEY
jgi:glycosyltransferase involved in cell wall biosynthesis